VKVVRPKRGLWRSTWWFLISPAAAVVWSSAVALIAVLFPPGYYERLILEPNYIYLSLPVVLYVGLCVLAFVFGYKLHEGLALFRSNGRRAPRERSSSGQQLIIPVVVAACVVLIPVSAYLLVNIVSTTSLSEIIRSLVGAQSSLMLRKGTHEAFSEGNLSYVFRAIMALVPWLVWQALGIRASRLRASAEGYVAVALVSLLLLMITVTSLLQQGKGELMYPVLAALVAWVAFRLRQGRPRPMRLLVAGTGAFIFGIAYFVLVTVTRSQASDGVVFGMQKLVAFTVGSYNRFAAILDGALVVPGGGGYYWTQWLWEMPVVQNIFDLESAATRIFGVIPLSGFDERTSYIGSAGLHETLTSFTIFAHSYVDFGWLGFAPFVAYGFLARLVWMAFKDARPWAIVLYPHVLWSILEWRGSLWVAKESILVFVAVAVAVGIGERIMRHYAATAGPAARPRGIEVGIRRRSWRRI
jgi:hypothetical protein